MKRSTLDVRQRTMDRKAQQLASSLARSAGTRNFSRRRLLQGAAGSAAAAGLGGGLALPAGSAAAQETTGTAIFVSPVDIPNIDPAIGHDGAISTSQKHLYDALYRHVGNPIELVPWLATGHEVNEEATEWTFTIDERARFHDGSPVTADAVVFSTRRVLDLNQGVAWMFAEILEPEGVEAIDPQTVKFTLTKPFAPFLHAATWLFVLNPAEVEANEVDGDSGQAWLVDHAAGSGPFEIGRWEPGNLYQFNAVSDYWRGWESDHVESFIFQVTAESSTKRLALQNGDAQMADWLSPQDRTLLESVPDVIVPRDPSLTTYVVKMNNQVGPTADVHVRRAISYAFDYQAMIDAMLGFATRIAGPLPENIAGAITIPVYETNLERAREELAKSPEYADGFDIEFAYVADLEEERQTGQILLDQLRQLNINVTLTGMEWVNAVALFSDPETSPSLFPIYSGDDYPDPDNYLWQAFHSSAQGTWMGADHYNNPEVDALLTQGRESVDEEERLAIYEQVQNIVIDDAVELYLWSPLTGYPHRTELKGYVDNPVMGSTPWWYQIWLEQG